MLVANSIDYAVIVCYILLMIGVGLYVIRFNSTASEYFRGGSRIPWLVAGLSSFMSGFSAWTFTGGAGVAYSSGIVSHRPLSGQCAELSAWLLCLRLALATHAHQHRDGVPRRSFRPDDSPDIFLGDYHLPALYQRNHAVWAEPVRLDRLPILRHCHHPRYRRRHPFL